MEHLFIRGEKLWLHPEKGIFWEARSTLLVADLHLGKGAHFRKAGIPVPLGVTDRNFTRLEQMLSDYQPKTVLLLGDIFHSDHNHVWELFKSFIASWPAISFELVPGNHDILSEQDYQGTALKIQPCYFVSPPFSFSHYPQAPEEIRPELYNFSGHLHPCVSLQSGQRNSLKLPCFYFGTDQAILPAFGEFTGCAEVAVKEGDQIFVLADDEVVAITS